MSADRNEALRLADAARIAELEQALDRLQGNYLIAFERGRIAGIAELEARVHTCGPTCSKAGCINRRLTAECDQLRIDLDDELCNREVLDTMLTQCIAERDQLRAEVERLRAPLSEDQIWYLTNDGMRNAAGGIYESSVIAFARAVERAHVAPEEGAA